MAEPTDRAHLALETLDVHQVASILRLHPESVRLMAQSGQLPARKIGKRWLFLPQTIHRYLLGEDFTTSAEQTSPIEVIPSWTKTIKPDVAHRGVPDAPQSHLYRNALAITRQPTRRRYRSRR